VLKPERGLWVEARSLSSLVSLNVSLYREAREALISLCIEKID
jgi:hypothetical protein